MSILRVRVRVSIELDTFERESIPDGSLKGSSIVISLVHEVPPLNYPIISPAT
jgi:hypothetical protein